LEWHNFSWAFTGFATKLVEVDPGTFIDAQNFWGGVTLATNCAVLTEQSGFLLFGIRKKLG
tara:strand:- start:174 stop:356 length:183 start_codon:yes stop_codon:yes gene_type:complete